MKIFLTSTKSFSDEVFSFQKEDADDNREAVDLTALGQLNTQHPAPYS